MTGVATHEHHPTHHDGDVHLDEATWAELAAQTELEGELLIGFVTDTMERVNDLRGPDAPTVRRVLDIGCGPGVSTCELARVFPAARVVGLDGSSAMLSRASRRANDHGLGDRVSTHLADLPGGLDGIEPVDLMWASMSLHHIGDQTSLLQVLRDLVAPSGVVAIAEIADPMAVLPERLDIGRPGLADRLERAGAEWFEALRRGLTGGAPSPDICSMLRSAGFDVIDSRIARERFDPPLSDAARQAVLGHLRRTRRHLAELLDAGDLEAIDVLTDEGDPRGVLHRPDVFVAASREIIVARPSEDR